MFIITISIRSSFFPILTVLILFTSGCLKNKKSETEKLAPKGFVSASMDLKPNHRPSLFFFHLKHCPNCDLVKRKLIPLPEFQKITKDFNKYYVDLGSEIGQYWMKKYDIHAAPVFVLTQPNHKFLRKSTTGYIGFSSFRSWLKSESSASFQIEQKFLGNLMSISKNDSLNLKSQPNLAYAFLSLKDSMGKAQPDTLKNVIEVAKKYLERDTKNLSDSDKIEALYRNAYVHLSLYYIYKSKNINTTSKMHAEKALKIYKTIDSQRFPIPSGNLSFQLMMLILLEKDDEVKFLVNKYAKVPNFNMPAVQLITVLMYKTERHECSKVFEFSKIIPTLKLDTDDHKIRNLYYRSQCWYEQDNISNLEREYDELMNHLSSSSKTLFKKRIDWVEQILESLKKGKKRFPVSSSILNRE